MSLAGYRPLDVLKARLLPADTAEDYSWDADLTDIGEGVAESFDRATGRTLRRTVGHIYQAAADRESYVVDLYPIEAITAATLKSGGSSSDVLSALQAIQHFSGIIDFGEALGSHTDILTVEITGGFWCDDGLTTLPTDAKPMPNDLLQAFYQQCRAVCEAENLFRSKAAVRPEVTKGGMTLATLDLLPSVRRTLQLYTRIG